MPTPPEDTRHNNLTKLLVLLPLRANSKRTFQCKTPCRFIKFRANVLKKSQKIANFPLNWLMSSIKMIQKWAPFAMQCYAEKNRQKWPFSSVHWSKIDLVLFSYFPPVSNRYVAKRSQVSDKKKMDIIFLPQMI